MGLTFQIALGVALGIVLGFYIREQQSKIKQKIDSFGDFINRYFVVIFVLFLSFFILNDFLYHVFIVGFTKAIAQSGGDIDGYVIAAVIACVFAVTHFMGLIFGFAFTYAHNIKVSYSYEPSEGDYFKIVFYGIIYADILAILMYLDNFIEGADDVGFYLFLTYYFGSIIYRFIKNRLT